MAEEGLKLIGSETCLFCSRVKLALIMKKLQCELVEEEDLSDESSLPVESNLAHKKTPVLVHNGKPIAESLVILEYIDETWQDHPILPKDPYERANDRFWAKFVDEKIVPAADKLMRANEEEKAEIIKAIHEQMIFLENELKRKGGCFGGDGIGYLDIVVYFVFYEFVIGKEVTKMELLDVDKFPVLAEWMGLLSQVSTISYCLPMEQDHIASIKARFEAAQSASK